MQLISDYRYNPSSGRFSIGVAVSVDTRLKFNNNYFDASKGEIVERSPLLSGSDTAALK